MIKENIDTLLILFVLAGFVLVIGLCLVFFYNFVPVHALVIGVVPVMLGCFGYVQIGERRRKA